VDVRPAPRVRRPVRAAPADVPTEIHLTITGLVGEHAIDVMVAAECDDKLLRPTPE
jgi:hypothetical protein